MMKRRMAVKRSCRRAGIMSCTSLLSSGRFSSPLYPQPVWSNSYPLIFIFILVVVMYNYSSSFSFFFPALRSSVLSYYIHMVLFFFLSNHSYFFTSPHIFLQINFIFKLADTPTSLCFLPANYLYEVYL